MTETILEVRKIAKAQSGSAAKPADWVIGAMVLDTGAPAIPEPLPCCRDDMFQRGGQ